MRLGYVGLHVWQLQTTLHPLGRRNKVWKQSAGSWMMGQWEISSPCQSMTICSFPSSEEGPVDGLWHCRSDGRLRTDVLERCGYSSRAE